MTRTLKYPQGSPQHLQILAHSGVSEANHMDEHMLRHGDRERDYSDRPVVHTAEDIKTPSPQKKEKR